MNVTISAGARGDVVMARAKNTFFTDIEAVEVISEDFVRLHFASDGRSVRRPMTIPVCKLGKIGERICAIAAKLLMENPPRRLN